MGFEGEGLGMQSESSCARIRNYKNASILAFPHSEFVELTNGFSHFVGYVEAF